MLGNNDQSISIVGDNCVASSPVSINSILSETSANHFVDPVATSVARGAAKSVALLNEERREPYYLSRSHSSLYGPFLPF
jgi:hypothetical protein